MRGSDVIALFLPHGSCQMVAGLVLIATASAWAIGREREPARTSQIAGRAVVASLAAVAMAILAGGAWRALLALAPGSWVVEGDVQGALPLLPGYQLGLLFGLWVALSPFRRAGRLVLALALLAASQVALVMTVDGAAARPGLVAHPLMLRAIALAVPVALAWLFFRPAARSGGYGDFWHGVGGEFPDLGGAASTDLYRANEVRLLSSQVSGWRGVKILKTDLWDEARNTRIMQWAASQGADVYGIDISEPTLRQAHERFGPGALKATLADVRRLPFADARFDVVYSMGTIEHFDESEHAVREMARALKPGGRLILGVPNRLDPFLRPVMVWLLWVLGLYGYGFEKSYSRRALRGMLERAGLTVVDESGILFIPGWLRMADLAAHTRLPALMRVTAPLVRVFAWLDRRFPRLRRHGYLLASTATHADYAPASSVRRAIAERTSSSEL